MERQPMAQPQINGNPLGNLGIHGVLVGHGMSCAKGRQGGGVAGNPQNQWKTVKTASNRASPTILLIPMATDHFREFCDGSVDVNFSRVTPILPNGRWRFIKGGAVYTNNPNHYHKYRFEILIIHILKS